MKLFALSRSRIRKACTAVLIAASYFAVPVSASLAGDSAVVLMYHRFGEGEFPTTNLRLEQLDAHIAELKSGPYTVLPLPEILRRQRAGEALPERVVGLSVDDAYVSVYSEAWPRLRDAGLPFTLFVSTDPIDRGYEGMMSWDMIRELTAAGVTIGAHTASHLHMPDHSMERLEEEIRKSNQRFEEELGVVPELFAYPYGEGGLDISALVAEAGYIAAFGQHSGAFGPEDDIFNLPRFPMNEKYGDMGRFKTAINALALPTADLTPEDTIVKEANPPAMGFTLTREMKRAPEIGCFLSHEGKASVENLGDIRFEVRVETPFPKGRTRLNCTMPGWGDNAGRWYWFGRQFYVGKSG